MAYQFDGTPVDIFAEVVPGLKLLPDEKPRLHGFCCLNSHTLGGFVMS